MPPIRVLPRALIRLTSEIKGGKIIRFANIPMTEGILKITTLGLSFFHCDQTQTNKITNHNTDTKAPISLALYILVSEI